MRATKDTRHCWRRTLSGVSLLLATTLAGCQVDVAGQTLPSPHYQQDDIQYFPPGPEFKLSREAAAQKAFDEDQAAQRGP